MVTDTVTDTTEPIIRDGQPIPAPIQGGTSRFELDKQVLELKRSGKSIREIAAQLKLATGWVQRSLNRSLRQFARDTGMNLSVSREEITRKIFEHAPNALSKVSTLMESAEKQEVQLKAATDLLDRAGFAPVQRTLNLTLVEEMSRDELIAGIRAILGATPTSTPQAPGQGAAT